MTIHPHAAECPRRHNAPGGRAEQARHPFTPGPWRYGPAANYDGFYIAPQNALPTLAACTVHNFPGQTEANARLIAKAPDMLALLKDCEESFTADDSYALLRDACRKLIAEIEQ